MQNHMFAAFGICIVCSPTCRLLPELRLENPEFESASRGLSDLGQNFRHHCPAFERLQCDLVNRPRLCAVFPHRGQHHLPHFLRPLLRERQTRLPVQLLVLLQRRRRVPLLHRRHRRLLVRRLVGHHHVQLLHHRHLVQREARVLRVPFVRRLLAQHAHRPRRLLRDGRRHHHVVLRRLAACTPCRRRHPVAAELAVGQHGVRGPRQRLLLPQARARLAAPPALLPLPAQLAERRRQNAPRLRADLQHGGLRAVPPPTHLQRPATLTRLQRLCERPGQPQHPVAAAAGPRRNPADGQRVPLALGTEEVFATPQKRPLLVVQRKGAIRLATAAHRRW
eukprot:Rhum_TRINITY_DN17279_c0_g1::Rhum_TRINITY_DN17279_c0_g1_i1::g.165469::m.165469